MHHKVGSLVSAVIQKCNLEFPWICGDHQSEESCLKIVHTRLMREMREISPGGDHHRLAVNPSSFEYPLIFDVRSISKIFVASVFILIHHRTAINLITRHHLTMQYSVEETC